MLRSSYRYGAIKVVMSELDAIAVKYSGTSSSKQRVFSLFQSESDNGYFDCKVLSRQHALLLYEDGKFFLMDTASSNGTFVNNIRYLNINSFIRPKCALPIAQFAYLI